jgi:hypothetical protein
MCEAQCASLRSRLERRINRVPSNKRNVKIIDILEPPAPVEVPKPVPVKKVKEPAAVAPSQGTRRARPAATTTATGAAQPATRRQPTKAPSKAAPKTIRGTKRNSDEISADDKENNAELNVPKKRAKAAPAPRATRATRAASKKVDGPAQVLSPKPNNARPPTANSTRTRTRQR